MTADIRAAAQRGERVIREFQGDDVWRDEDGQIWQRLSETVEVVKATIDLTIARVTPTREQIAEVIASSGAYGFKWEQVRPMTRDAYLAAADAILAAGFSRATVPDAATEGRLTQAELEDIAETHAFCADRLFIETELVDEIRAERDAAVAAVERVRGVLSEWESRQERNREILGSGALGHFQAIDCTGDLVAALDGAPEPEPIEWEYEYADDDDPEGIVYGKFRRVVGPWLPVEGESND